MAIDLSGRDTSIRATAVRIFITENHPLIKLAGALPWPSLIDLVVEDLKKTTKNGFWQKGRRIVVRIHFNDLDRFYRCDACGSALRPHIVWFGETPFHMAEITKLVAQCDIFVAVGTSGQVYPAAGLVRLAEESGAYTLEINQQATGSGFDAVLERNATEAVPLFVETVVSAISRGVEDDGNERKIKHD